MLTWLLRFRHGSACSSVWHFPLRPPSSRQLSLSVSLSAFPPLCLFNPPPPPHLASVLRSSREAYCSAFRAPRRHRSTLRKSAHGQTAHEQINWVSQKRETKKKRDALVPPWDILHNPPPSPQHTHLTYSLSPCWLAQSPATSKINIWFGGRDNNTCVYWKTLREFDFFSWV